MTRIVLILLILGFSAEAFARRLTEDFGSVGVGAKMTKIIYFRNRTWGGLEFERFYFDGSKPFSYTTNCERYLPEGSECWAKVTVEPKKTGNYSATLEVSYTTGKSTLIDYFATGVN